MPLPLTAGKLAPMRGLSDPMGVGEAKDAYLRRSRLLNRFLAAAMRLRDVVAECAAK